MTCHGGLHCHGNFGGNGRWLHHGGGVTEQSVHKALSSDSRARLIGLLRQAGRPCSVVELAESTGLHVNTVRGHLDVLVRVGLAERSRSRRSTPGRPSVLYSPTVASLPPQESLVADAQAWARDHAQFEVGSATGRDAAVALVTQMLAERGFAPRGEEGGHLVLTACPYSDLAGAEQRLVCGLHLGLVRGALDRMGAPFTARFVSVDVLTPRCVIEFVDRSPTNEESAP